ncbi:hypothetical protein SAMN04488074_110151 [Lentzea albidocapillata subsp. violacea]|uniref:Uncharacterized protein n=1 Tax=Lentzea albidocapillata subsp. violacea TaxID=128104 RepID=A0A1G9J785_9PSEU|nr:hypothetical protein [Lentzea albidocapillata]SDL32984.1 hypothetical protein SAMN04488074_110151 [Lentzea albidocapillata subsp. violacea]
MTTPNQPLGRPQIPLGAGVPVPHLPTGVGPVLGQPVTPVDWFRRMPNGGTVFLKPADAAEND